MKKTVNKNLIFSAVALGMSVSGIVLTLLHESTASVLIIYGVGLFLMAINSLEANRLD